MIASLGSESQLAMLPDYFSNEQVSMKPIAFSLLSTLAVFGVCNIAHAEGSAKAMAVMVPTKGSTVSGTVAFEDNGKVTHVKTQLTGLTPGKHGFHIHEFGDCSAPDAMSAGGHFNPSGSPHGAPNDKERHSGDLGNLVADASGNALLDLQDAHLKLSGDTTLIGRSVIVHANEDDLKTQPTGNAGGRVACGVIGVAKP